MSRRQPSSDPENPEWTEEDFARARYGEDIPADVRAAFGSGSKRSISRLVAAQGPGFAPSSLAA